jgi:integrase
MADAVRAVLAGPRKHARWVFPNAWGRRFKDFPHAQYWLARDKAGLRGGPHTTRHTYASHFLANFTGPNALQVLADILGHSATKVTEIYAHLLPGHLDAARNAVNLSPALAPAVAKSS